MALGTTLGLNCLLTGGLHCTIIRSRRTTWSGSMGCFSPGLGPFWGATGQPDSFSSMCVPSTHCRHLGCSFSYTATTTSFAFHFPKISQKLCFLVSCLVLFDFVVLNSFDYFTVTLRAFPGEKQINTCG